MRPTSVIRLFPLLFSPLAVGTHCLWKGKGTGEGCGDERSDVWVGEERGRGEEGWRVWGSGPSGGGGGRSRRLEPAVAPGLRSVHESALRGHFLSQGPC